MYSGVYISPIYVFEQNHYPYVSPSIRVIVLVFVRRMVIRAKRVSNCYIKKKYIYIYIYACVRLILVLVGGRQTVYGQNTVYLCLSKYVPPVDAHVYDSMIPGTYYVPAVSYTHLTLPTIYSV